MSADVSQVTLLAASQVTLPLIVKRMQGRLPLWKPESYCFIEL
jgi:hypothetical protein